MGRLLLNLLLNSCLFINTIAFLFNFDFFFSNDEPKPEFRLPDYIIPVHYDIQLDLTYFDAEEDLFKYIFGVCNVDINITRPTRYISLHAKKPQIKVQDASLANIKSLEIYKWTYVTYNNESHILVFDFYYQLPVGRYILKMNFTSFANDDGSFLRITYANSNRNKA